MVRSTANRSLRAASCCSVEVMNGGYGRRVYGLVSTLVTSNGVRSSAAASSRAGRSVRCRALPRTVPVSGSKSRPVATRRPSTDTSVAVNVEGSPASVPAAAPAASVPAAPILARALLDGALLAGAVRAPLPALKVPSMSQ